MRFRRFAVALVAALFPLAALAAGGHDSVGCTGCHGIHNAKGEVIFAVPANKVALNPRTKQPYGGTTGLCLGCHEETSKGGQGYAPVSSHISHPYGLERVNPKVAKVPSEFLNAGRFECVGCHDPHPSNPNYKYLRVDTAKGSKMDQFCAMCHASKSDLVAAAPVIFSSMDETAPPPVPPPAAKPAEKKK